MGDAREVQIVGDGVGEEAQFPSIPGATSFQARAAGRVEGTQARTTHPLGSHRW
jgi:hypothetical protein